MTLITNKNDYNVNKVSEEGIRLLHTKSITGSARSIRFIGNSKLQNEMFASLTKQLVSMQEEQVV